VVVVVFAMQASASWKALLEVTKTAWTQNEFPLAWGTDALTCVHEEGLGLPSVELAQVLLHCLSINASSHGGPPPAATLWSYIQHAMSSQMVSALHMLALLTSRSFPDSFPHF